METTAIPTIARQARAASVFFQAEGQDDNSRFLAWFGMRVRTGREVTAEQIGRAFDLIDLSEAVRAADAVVVAAA